MAIMSPEETARRFAANRAKNPRYNPSDPTSGVNPADLPLPSGVRTENLRPDQTLEGLQRINMNRMAGVNKPVQQTAVQVEQPINPADAQAQATALANRAFLRQAMDRAHREFMNPAFYNTTAADARTKLEELSKASINLHRATAEPGTPLQGEDKQRFMNAGKEATNLLNPEGQPPSTPNADLFARAKAVQATFAAKRQQAALGLGDNTMAEYRGLTTPPANLDPATRNEQVMSEQSAQRLARLKRLEAAGVQLSPEENAQVPVPDQGPSPQDRAEGVAAFTGEMNQINARRAISPEMLRDRAVAKSVQRGQLEDANTSIEGLRKNDAEMLANRRALEAARIKGQTAQAMQAGGGKSPELLAAENAAALARAQADTRKAQAEGGGVDVMAEHAAAVNALGGPGSGDSKIADAITDFNDEGGFLLRGTLNSLTGVRGLMNEIDTIQNPATRRAIANAILRGVEPAKRSRILQYPDDNEGKRLFLKLIAYQAGQ